ncbi:hypothetical protein ACVBRP_004824 [Klebsiella pneumoniae]|uniref:hypothetical protein n=1 Tax=Klebsiella pneumoniae TaxID=573 RepID=UPI001CDADB31|nr:hypothetical protein [Klebsiella pneumoniae]HBR5011531.1 hypothetical protein [Klebsiella pneumoniae]HBT4571029.1 hypothetical protein [Klebsiella pneumoniae]HBV3127815.1 hypothetical protein [Klebsiella pneumoniae]HBX7752984.1 hypothetical protein [Klebsiella pneumoniae]HCB0365008.1 hypothetical protein [Klebsiella pneumoniae]
MKIDIGSMLNEIKSDNESKNKTGHEENQYYKMICEIYDEIKNNNELSNKNIKLSEPRAEYKILDYCRNGTIEYTSGSWGSYHSDTLFYILEPKKEGSPCGSGIKTSYIGPRGGNHGDFTFTYLTVEEGLKEFLKKIIF